MKIREEEEGQLESKPVDGEEDWPPSPPHQGHHRHRTRATVNAENVNFFSFGSKLNFESPYTHIGAKRPMGEPKNASGAWPSCDQKFLWWTPFYFSFPISLDFLTFAFLVSFFCRLVKEKPRLQQRNDRTTTPENLSASKVSVFSFFWQKETP